jgi:hypothetical protein
MQSERIRKEVGYRGEWENKEEAKGEVQAVE